MKKILVEFEFDEERLGKEWFNIYNLELLLYGINHNTNKELLKILSFKEVKK